MPLPDNLRALDRSLQENLKARGERLSGTEAPAASLPARLPTPAETAAAWVPPAPAPPWMRSVPGGRWCVSYGFTGQKKYDRTVHRAASPADLVRFVRDYLGPNPCAIVWRIWEDDDSQVAGWRYGGYHCRKCSLEVGPAAQVIVNEEGEYCGDGYRDLTTVRHVMCPPEE